MHKEENYGLLQPEIMDRTVPFEIAADFVLPDYRSEISRLLWVRPTFLPPERFVGGGKAEFSGRILFEVLYTGPDGVLYGADPDEGYSFSVPLDGMTAEPGIELYAEPVVDAVISRVTGPRRLAVRCRVHARVRGYAQKTQEIKKRGLPEGAQPHVLCDVAELGRFIGGGREEFSLSDAVDCEGEVRAVCARGSIFLPEVRAGHDEILCRGEALLTLLLCREDGERPRPFTLTRRIPFERAVPLEGVHPDHRACATGTVGRIELSVQDGHVHLTPQIILTAQSQYTQPTTVCRDLFLCGYRAECRFESESTWTAGECCNRNFSISPERALSELGIGEDTEIVDLAAEPELCQKRTEGEKLLLEGKLQCHLLCRNGGELCTYDVALPFRLAQDGISESADVECRVADCRVSMRGGMLRADAEIQLCLRDAQHAPLHTLCEVQFTPLETPVRAPIELYYPTPAQTLWDVAKEYGVAPDALAEANGLDGDDPANPTSLSGKRFLLIP